MGQGKEETSQRGVAGFTKVFWFVKIRLFSRGIRCKLKRPFKGARCSSFYRMEYVVVRVIVLDNKNNIAKLTNLNDVESSDKVINYSYEDMCNLIDQLTVKKIHISGPNNILYGISYAHDSTDKDSQKNENTEDKDFDLSNADISLDELKIIIEGNKKETNENYDKVLEDCLTAIVNTINSQGVNTISVTSNTQNTETTK